MPIDIRNALAGISGVHVTPFDTQDRIAPAVLAEVIDRLARAGIDNIVAAGNTGEFYALEPEEIGQVYRLVVEANAGRSAVTAGVGRSVKEACAMARDAERAGADAIMIHQPPDPFASPRGMVDYARAVADSTALPVILYVRRDAFSADEFRGLLDHPNIIGMKYAVPELVRFAERARMTVAMDKIMVSGLAEPWAPSFQTAGARGFTSGLVNVLPALSVAVRDALKADRYDIAQQECAKIAAFEALRAQEGNGWNVTVVKQAMRRLGIPVGPARVPATPALPERHASELDAILRSWGVLT